MTDPWFLFVFAVMSGLALTLFGVGLIVTVREVLRAAREGWRTRW